jgi:hypothetical protein
MNTLRVSGSGMITLAIVYAAALAAAQSALTGLTLRLQALCLVPLFLGGLVHAKSGLQSPTSDYRTTVRSIIK